MAITVTKETIARARAKRENKSRKSVRDVGALKKEKETFAGNFKKDFSSFAKGVIGLPIVAAKALWNNPKESAKTAGRFIKTVGSIAKPMAGSNYGHPVAQAAIAAAKKIYQPAKRYANTSFEEKEKTFQEQTKKYDSLPSGERGAKIAGESAVKDFMQLLVDPADTLYKRPFTGALDALSLGAGKVISAASKAGKVEITSRLSQTPRGRAILEKLNKTGDKISADGGLSRSGYKDVAQDIATSRASKRKLVSSVQKETAELFDKKYNLSAKERVEMQRALNTLYDTGKLPTVSPKIASAIKEYQKKIIPLQERESGILEKRQSQAALAKGKIEKSTGGILEEISRLKQSRERKVVSGVNKLRKTKYTPEDILKSVLKELKSGRKSALVPSKASDAVISSRRASIMERPLTSNRLKALVQEKMDAKASAAQASKPTDPGYIHRYFKQDASYAPGMAPSAKSGYLKQRTGAEGYVEDPYVSIAGLRIKAGTDRINRALTEKIHGKYAVSQDNVIIGNGKFFDKNSGVELADFQGMMIPKKLQELITTATQTDDIVRTILTPLRAFNRNWKPLATSVRPRYHLRNIIGNLYNAVFVGGMDPKAMAPALSAQMAKYIAGMRADSFAGRILRPLFKNNPDKKYIQMAIQDDVVGRGFFGADLNDMADLLDNADDVTKLLSRIDNPAMIYRVPLLRQWIKGSQRVGQALEDHFRLSMYIDSLKKGMSRAEAKSRVNTHLFDYIDGLGKADQYMKAFIPFWAWTRFNIPLQLAALYKLPMRHAAIQHGIGPEVAQQEQENPNYDFLSDREKNMGSFKVGEVQVGDKTMDKYIRTQNVLPIQDVTKLADFAQLNSDDLGVTPLGRMLEQLRYRMNPPKDPNQNLDYYGRPVEQFEGERKKFLSGSVRGTDKEILSAIPVISEINKAIGGSYFNGEHPGYKETAKTAFSPFSSFLADREKNMDYVVNDFLRETKGSYSNGYEGALRSVVKKIAESSNPEKSVLENGKILVGLLRDSGYDDKELVDIVLKTIINDLKNKKKNEKKSSNERQLLQKIEELKSR